MQVVGEQAICNWLNRLCGEQLGEIRTQLSNSGFMRDAETNSTLSHRGLDHESRIEIGGATSHRSAVAKHHRH